MNTEILVIIIVLIIGGIMLYFLQQQTTNVDNFNIIEEEIPEIKEEQINWYSKEHIGWLYKNGDVDNHQSNYMLYYNPDNNMFLANSIFGEEHFDLDLENPSEGVSVGINNEKYVIHMWNEDEE